MKKKLLTLLLSAAVCVSAIPGSVANAAKTTTTTIIDDEEKGDDDIDDDDAAASTDDDDDDDVPGMELTKYDLSVYPAKKTIRIGQSFTIDITATDESEFADLDDEEWDELCENNIDSISFRSTKTSIASVNKTTGRVKGKKKGNAVIKTTIHLANGESVTLKSKIYVKR